MFCYLFIFLINKRTNTHKQFSWPRGVCVCWQNSSIRYRKWNDFTYFMLQYKYARRQFSIDSARLTLTIEKQVNFVQLWSCYLTTLFILKRGDIVCYILNWMTRVCFCSYSYYFSYCLLVISEMHLLKQVVCLYDQLSYNWNKNLG